MDELERENEKMRKRCRMKEGSIMNREETEQEENSEEEKQKNEKL